VWVGIFFGGEEIRTEMSGPSARSGSDGGAK
jgi:hypothetical protein